MSTATASKKSTKTAAVNDANVAAGNILVKDITVTETPVQKVKIDKNKILKDTTGTLISIAAIDALEPLRDELSEAIKQRMIDNGAGKIEDEFNQGYIGGGSPGRKVNIAKFLAKCKARKIETAKMHAAMSVAIDKLTFLSDEEVTEICDPTPPAAIRLTISRKKEAAPITVLNAINSLADEAKAGKIKEPASKAKKNGSK